MRTYRNDTEYVKRREALRRKAKKHNLPCWLCHEPIDFNAEWKHPLSFTADHVQAVANGGHMLGELKPAHRSCNSKKGNRPAHTASPKPQPVTGWY